MAASRYASSGPGAAASEDVTLAGGSDDIAHEGAGDKTPGGKRNKIVAFKTSAKSGYALAAVAVGAALVAAASSGETDDKVVALVNDEVDVTAALKGLKAAVNPKIGNPAKYLDFWDDAELAYLSLLGPKPDELTIHGKYVLGIGIWYAHLGRPFNYTDVQTVTDELYGKPMVTAMIYKTIEALKERAFLIDKGRMIDPQSGRAVSYYEISDAGRTALKGAVLNSYILEKLQVDAA